MIESKLLKKLKKKTLDVREFRNEITRLRFTNKDAREMMKELRNKGLIDYDRRYVKLRKKSRL